MRQRILSVPRKQNLYISSDSSACQGCMGKNDDRNMWILIKMNGLPFRSRRKYNQPSTVVEWSTWGNMSSEELGCWLAGHLAMKLATILIMETHMWVYKSPGHCGYFIYLFCANTRMATQQNWSTCCHWWSLQARKCLKGIWCLNY